MKIQSKLANHQFLKSNRLNFLEGLFRRVFNGHFRRMRCPFSKPGELCSMIHYRRGKIYCRTQFTRVFFLKPHFQREAHYFFVIYQRCLSIIIVFVFQPNRNPFQRRCHKSNQGRIGGPDPLMGGRAFPSSFNGLI